MSTILNIKEAHLVALLQSGNEQGLRILYSNYNQSIYGIISNIVKSEQHAEEVLNDVFLKFYRSIKSYDPGQSKLFTWMARIARNAAIDKIRTVDYRRSQNSVDIENPAVKALNYSENNLDNEGLAKVLKSLDGDQKRMVEMVYLLGYTHQECSDELNVPLGTVKSNVRRGILKMRDYLGKDLQAYMSILLIVFIYFLIHR
ncbi:MAG: RNA polymerase sigma factor [Saprospiraceae bacterium]